MLKITISLEAVNEEDAELQVKEIAEKIGNEFKLGPGYVVEGTRVKCFTCYDTKKVRVGEHDDIDEVDCQDCTEPELSVEEQMDDDSDNLLDSEKNNG